MWGRRTALCLLLCMSCSLAFKTPICLGPKGASQDMRVLRARGSCCALRGSLASSAEAQVESWDRIKNIPWSESVAGKEHNLLYMPFLEWQCKYMKENFETLEDKPFARPLSFQRSPEKKPPAVAESWQFKTEHFRKIRMTYIDAGVRAQVYNCVIYPDYKYDLPILGIDFLSFGKSKFLAILDLQPLTQDPEYLKKYIEPLHPIRSKYEDLCGRMSSKFYDETRFFSKEMLFGKFDNAVPVMESLFPAFKEYFEHYISVAGGLEGDESPEAIARVKQLHKDYDQYSAEKDPAVGLFATYWGQEWAERFTHEFLFSESVPVPHAD